MSDLDRFRDMVHGDESLAEQLWQVTQADAFLALVVELAAERGLTLAPGDLWKEQADARLRWFETWSS